MNRSQKKESLSVETYLERNSEWKDHLARLRSILLNAGLEETIKWNAPCYTLDGKNIIGLASFKSYCGLWFFQGALLTDPAGVLVNAQAGRTKAQRQWRFQRGEELDEELISAYVAEAVRNQKRGLEIKVERGGDLKIPSELNAALANDSELRSAFESLTPGRRKEYATFIAEAKRAGTKQKRLEKILPMIRSKVGLNDKYRS